MSLAEQMIRNLQFEDNYLEATQQKSEEHIVVDESRRINIPASLKTIAVTGDYRVESVTFDCVRYWDEHDLSTFSIYINYILPNNKVSTYIPKSVWLDENDESVFHFEWEIWSVMTQYQGIITFGITAIQDGQPGRQWSSLPSKDFVVAQGVEVSFTPEEEIEAPTILQQMSKILAEMQSTALIGSVVQITGTSETDVMSQKGVTDALENYKTNLLEAIATAKSESISASKQYTDTKKAELDGNIAQNTQKISENTTSIGENAKKIAQNSSRISANDKRLINLEKGYNDEPFVTESSASNLGVPSNALPYAEISKVWGGADNVRSYSLETEPFTTVNLTLDTSALPSTVTVEKLDDGSIKFSGYTEYQGTTPFKFATANLQSYKNYDIYYEVISYVDTGFSSYGFNVENAQGTTVDLTEASKTLNSNSGNVTFNFYIGTGGDGAEQLIVKFKARVPENKSPVVHDKYQIPEKVRALDGFFNSNNYIDFDKGVFVRNDTVEEIDIREYIGYDNFIQVVGGGWVECMEQTIGGNIGVGPIEMTFMLKGV